MGGRCSSPIKLWNLLPYPILADRFKGSGFSLLNSFEFPSQVFYLSSLFLPKRRAPGLGNLVAGGTVDFIPFFARQAQSGRFCAVPQPAGVHGSSDWLDMRRVPQDPCQRNGRI